MGGIRFGRMRLVVGAQDPGRVAVKKLGKSVGLLVALLVGALALVPAGASAEPLCTDTWTGPGEGEWQTASDWSTGKVPSSSDVACVGAEKTVEVTGGTDHAGVLEDKGTIAISGGSLELVSALEASSATSLTLTGGTLTGAGSLDVSGSFLWEGTSTISGSGMLVLESGMSSARITRYGVGSSSESMSLEGRTFGQRRYAGL